MSTINRQILLASRPKGEPGADNFKLVETPVAPLADGQVLVRHGGRVVGFQRRVERLEPPGQRAGDGGQPRVIAVGRAWRGGAGGQP